MIFWYILTLLAEPEVWGVIGVCLIVLYLLLRKTALAKKPGFRVFKGFIIIFVLSLFITFGIVNALKIGFQVPRICTPCPAGESGQFPLAPPLLLGEGETVCNPYCPPDSSFPSGHAATVFVLFTSLYLVIRKKWFLPLFIIPVLMSLSRVMLEVHTYTDILVGTVLGILVTLALWKKRAFLERKLSKKPVF